MTRATRTRGLRLRTAATIAVVSICAATLFAGCTAGDATSTEGSASTRPQATGSAAQSTPISGTFDVGGGRMMYLECSGIGSPTVVLIGGLRGGADYWNQAGEDQPPVYPQIAETTRVCIYDRPGTVLEGNAFSRSDPIDQPSTVAPTVADLHALLEAADVPGPYVFGAHSYGGMVARLFASTYPDEVAGLVLIDALSEEFESAMTPEQYDAWKISNETDPEDIAAYPPIERLDTDTTFAQMRNAPAISPMPVTVLSSDVKYGPIWQSLIDDRTMPAGTPAELGYWIDNAQVASQRFQAQLVQDAVHITETHSGHDIPHENSELVIEAIQDVVAQTR